MAPRRIRQRPEEALHKTVAAFLNIGLPYNVLWTTFPAGGGGKVRGAQLKAMGLKPGWPDIQILAGGRLICIELKATTDLSREQVECHAALCNAGAAVHVCRTLEEVQAALAFEGVPCRASPFGIGFIRPTTPTRMKTAKWSVA